ncbi:unnamed protein product [Prorocentrum cordatum]|uniref:Uncharacterized protein n=1 Tax=Prorocentrum cordatum TaxID=2364126 RepID=A0ABN9PLY0_9DINO|nr:unnamed protein product [Polarella glacialis]
MPPDRVLVCCSTSSVLLGGAGILAWRRLQRWLAVVLLLASSTSLFVGAAWNSGACAKAWRRVQQGACQIVARAIVGIAVQISSDPYADALLGAAGSVIRQATAHQELKAALKCAVVEGMRFEQLHDEIVGTLTGSMVAASRDKGLRGALLSIITTALRDEEFMSQMLATMTDATVSAAQNRHLRDSVLGVAKIAITDAVKDESFVADVTTALTDAGLRAARDGEIRGALVDIAKVAIVEALKDDSFLQVLRETVANSLRDGQIYRGAALGVLGAINPFGRGRAPAEEAEERCEERSPSNASAASSS